jgi:hypothetical protein
MMKVTIKTEQTTVRKGLLKQVPWYVVRCQVAFDEEELAIIESARLKNIEIIEIDYGNHTRPVTFDNFLQGYGINNGFPTPAEANNFELLIRDDILPRVKGMLRASTIEDKTDSFEL